MAVALLLSGCAGSSQQQSAPQNTAFPPSAVSPASGNPLTSTVDGPAASPPSPPSGQAGITPAELAAHNTDVDCWVAYEGKVYDITSFLPVHKGGPAKIVPTCGTASEFAAAFEAKHGASKVDVLLSQGVLKGELSSG